MSLQKTGNTKAGKGQWKKKARLHKSEMNEMEMREMRGQEEDKKRKE